MTRRLILQYFATFLIYAGALFLTFWISIRFFDLLLTEETALILLIVSLLLWIVITFFFLARPVRYLDELIFSAGQLAENPAVPIVLSPAMQNVQTELDLVRQRALRNALLEKETEKRKNDLLMYLAHDLKTPLTSVIGYLTLLRDAPELDPALRANYTGIALDKAERLEELINEFFDITRFSLTTLTLEPQQRSLSRMLEQIASEFTPVLAEKELYWHMKIAPDVVITCDPDKLERLMDNLIRNAIHYSYPRTALTFTMMPQSNEQIQISLANHGPTIPPEKLEHLFEQFYRLDSARSSDTGGAGLGLAIAKEIAELHGGRIFAESHQEEICFTVILPADCKKIVRNS